MTSAGRPTQTSPAMWSEAALSEIESVGVRAMSVQSVARRLGVTKGGFYYHFADRDELLRSALTLWELRFVTEFGAQAEAIADPRERLQAILTKAVVELRPTVLVQLMAANEIAVVAETLNRAAVARVAMLRRIFVELGLDDDVAQRRAVLAYGAFVGLAELHLQLPLELATDTALRGYADEFERAIVPA